MAATPITQSTRYTDQSVTKVYFLTTIASASLVPTRAELNAGTDLSREINDMSGWTVTANLIDTPDLGSSFTAKIPGSTSSEDSSLTLYTSKNGVDVRTILPRTTTGYIVMLDGGDIPTGKAEIYPVTVTSNGVMRTATGREASKVQVGFAITREPAQGVTIPA